MKKIAALILALVLCLSLAACGGPDKEPAIQAFNSTSKAFDELVHIINTVPDHFTQEQTDTIRKMSGQLQEYKALLESDHEFTEEELQEMIQWFKTVESAIVKIRAEYGI